MEDRCFINRLMSTDLLREIFSHLILLDNLHSLYPFHIPGRNRAPLLLTFVCSHWRTISLQTPTLWSSLVIDIEGVLDGGGKRCLYQLWLDRAWGTPVSLEIIDIRRSKAHCLQQGDWIDFLLTNIPYWKVVSLGPVVANSLFSGLLSKPRGTARHLQGIRLGFTPYEFLDTRCHNKLSTLFPNLSQLYLTAMNYVGFGDIPTNNLTHLSCNLDLFRVLVTSAKEGIIVLSKLIELFLYHENTAGPVSDSRYTDQGAMSNAIHCPELKYLQIFDRDLPVVRDVFHILQCPQLEFLHIVNKSVTFGGSQTPVASADFSFFVRFLAKTPSLRYVVARSASFLTATFLNHPAIRTGIQYVQVSVPTSFSRYRTVDDARRSFGNKWKAEGLEVVFSTGKENTKFTTSMAYVGWSRFPDQPLGVPLCKRWPSAFWDQEAYVQYVREVKADRLVPC